MKLTSPSFQNGAASPSRFTGEGADVSPALKWEGALSGVKSFALICDDPDAPNGDWVHWLIWNISGTATELPENVAKTETVPALSGAKQGLNSWPQVGYNGPMPPRGHGIHHYHFKLYALCNTLSLPPKVTKQQLLATINAWKLAEAELVGTYERK